jgi:hypothetical protein
MAVTCLPYLYVAAFAPPGRPFTGLLYLGEDHCVYLAWAEQAAQGHFLMRNLFTGDAQRGIYVSLLSWLVGSVAHLTGLPLILVHHATRLIAGVLLLILAYRLFAQFTTDVTRRRAAFWFVALGSGFGWLTAAKTAIDTGDLVDLWQAEAITFLCLYVNGLFCVALCLMLGIFLLLLQAEGTRGAARWRRVVGAGFLGLLLGNIHSYDIITVVAVWVAYVAVRAVASHGSRVTGHGSSGPEMQPRTGLLVSPNPGLATRDPRHFSLSRALADAVVAAVVALPSTLYQYYLYRTEPVFRMRADDHTSSGPFLSLVLGYGLLLIVAVGGIVWLVRARRRSGEPLGQWLFPMVWAVVGFGLPYLPLSFQRKLVMGLHLPLAFLAAVGAVSLARWGAGRASRVVSRRPFDLRPVTRDPRLVVGALVLLAAPSNWRCIRADIEFARGELLNPYTITTFLPRADRDAMLWAGRHLVRDGVVLCAKGSGIMLPALAARPVYVGHGSETPHSVPREQEALRFFQEKRATAAERWAFLRDHHIRYVYYGSVERHLGGLDPAGDPLFRSIYRNPGAALYEVEPLLANRPGSSRAGARQYP